MVLELDCNLEIPVFLDGSEAGVLPQSSSGARAAPNVAAQAIIVRLGGRVTSK